MLLPAAKIGVQLWSCSAAPVMLPVASRQRDAQERVRFVGAESAPAPRPVWKLERHIMHFQDITEACDLLIKCSEIINSKSTF